MHVRIEFEDAFVERSTQNCTFDLESKMDFEQGPHKNLIFEFDLTFSNSNRSLGFVVTPTQKSHFRILSTVRQLKFFNFENSKSRFGGVGQNWSNKNIVPGPVCLTVRTRSDQPLPLLSRLTLQANAHCLRVSH